MSLPSASSILKRARQEDPSEKVDKAYQAIVKLIKDADPVKLCTGDGIKLSISNVPEIANCSAEETQSVFARVANNKGYIVNVCIGDDVWIDVPAYVWDWHEFWHCTYDSLSTVWVRVQE